MSVVLHHVGLWVGTNTAEETVASSYRITEEVGSSETWLPVYKLHGVTSQKSCCPTVELGYLLGQ